MAKETQDLLSFAAGDGVQLDIEDVRALRDEYEANDKAAGRYMVGGKVVVQPETLDKVRKKLETEAKARGLDLSKVEII